MDPAKIREALELEELVNGTQHEAKSRKLFQFMLDFTVDLMNEAKSEGNPDLIIPERLEQMAQHIFDNDLGHYITEVMLVCSTIVALLSGVLRTDRIEELNEVLDRINTMQTVSTVGTMLARDLINDHVHTERTAN